MGIMRALSMKRASGVPTRSFSTLKGRPQISLPTELISSTNKITSTAPDVKVMQQAIANAASTNDDDNASYAEQSVLESISETPSTPTMSDDSRRCSDLSTGSAPSLTDNSSVSSSPSSPDPHLTLPSRTSYFAVDTLTKPSSNTSTQILADDSVDPFTILTPVVPRRAASHSKKEHVRLARRRSERQSLRSLNSSSLSASSSAEDEVVAGEVISSPLSIIMPELPEVEEESQAIDQTIPQIQLQEPESEEVIKDSVQHPFSQELEQLTEAVEELSALVEDEDTRIMRERGLKRWSVDGYLELVGNAWENPYASFNEVVVA